MSVNKLGNSTIPLNVMPPKIGGVGEVAEADSAPKTDISKMAGLMNQLQQLSQSDPGKFKAVMSEVGDKLTTAASSATGRQADQLKKMADKFEKAAETGDIASIEPERIEASANTHHVAYASAVQNAQSVGLQQMIEQAIDTSQG